MKDNSANGNGEANFGLNGHGNTVSNNTASGGIFGFATTGDRNTLHANSASDASAHGFGQEGNDNVFTDNFVTGTPVEAAFRTGGIRNTITGNVANDNNFVGFEDISVPGSNEYVDNVCLNNGGGGSSPEGLCSIVPPAESPADDSTSVEDG